MAVDFDAVDSEPDRGFGIAGERAVQADAAIGDPLRGLRARGDS